MNDNDSFCKIVVADSFFKIVDAMSKEEARKSLPLAYLNLRSYFTEEEQKLLDSFFGLKKAPPSPQSPPPMIASIPNPDLFR